MKLFILITLLFWLLGCEDLSMAYGHAHRYKHASTHYKKYSIKTPKAWDYGKPKPPHWKEIETGD